MKKTKSKDLGVIQGVYHDHSNFESKYVKSCLYMNIFHRKWKGECLCLQTFTGNSIYLDEKGINELIKLLIEYKLE